MAARKYQKDGGRAYLSKSDWKKLLTFIRHALQRSSNEVGLAGPDTDDTEWKTWFCQFFEHDLKARFWRAEGKGGARFARYEEEIVQLTMTLCRDTARKMRLERLPSGNEIRKIHNLATSVDLLAQGRQENLLSKEFGGNQVTPKSYKGPEGDTAAGEPKPSIGRGQLTAGPKMRRDYVSPNVDRANSTLFAPTEHKGLTANSRRLQLPVGRMSRESDNEGAQREAPPAQFQVDGSCQSTGRGLRGPCWDGATLTARISMQNHPLPAPTRLPDLYAWAVSIHLKQIYSKPIRHIFYRKTIPSLRRFLHGTMSARGITSGFAVHNLVVSSNGNAVRVKVNTPQEKYDWYHVASRVFETGRLVDIDIWIR